MSRATSVEVYASRQRVEHEPRLEAAHEATRLQPLSVVHPRKCLWLIDWVQLTRGLRHDLIAVVPPCADLVFVDDEQLRDHVCPDARPFPEQAGQWTGPPLDDTTALRELDRVSHDGASFLAFAQPAFWWFYRQLRSRFPCRLDNERIVVFDLRGATQS